MCGRCGWMLAYDEGMITQGDGASRLMPDSMAHFKKQFGIDRQYGLLAASLPTTIHILGKIKFVVPSADYFQRLYYVLTIK